MIRKHRNFITTSIRATSPRKSPSSRLKIKRHYLAFAILLLNIVFSVATQSIAKEDSTLGSLSLAKSYLIQEAIDHAMHQYGIEILSREDLMDQQVSPWDDKALPAEEWVSQVFRSYDKIVFYDDKGRIKGINIISLKNGQANISPNNFDSIGARAKLSEKLSKAKGLEIPNDTVVVNTYGHSPEGLEDININESNEEQALPEGVTIYNTSQNPDSHHPVGVIIGDPLQNK